MKRSRYTRRPWASSAAPSRSKVTMSSRRTRPGAMLRASRKCAGDLSCRALTCPKPSTTRWSYRMRLAATSLSTSTPSGAGAVTIAFPAELPMSFPRVLDVGVLVELDVVQESAHFFDSPYVYRLHDVARLGIDHDRPAWAHEPHSLERSY